MDRKAEQISPEVLDHRGLRVARRAGRVDVAQDVCEVINDY